MAETIPPLRVQRMGKNWRIVYDETRTLARFNSGEPLDEGGFPDVWKDGKKVEDGQLLCMQKMSEITGDKTMDDPEAENIGN